MIVKILAAAVVVAGGMYFGRYMAGGLRVHTAQLAAFGEALKQLEFNIRFFNLPVSEAIYGVSETRKGVVGKIFKRTGEILKNRGDASACDAWNTAVFENRKKLLLSDDELKILNMFIVNLGRGDVESEIDNISAACLRLKAVEASAREEAEKNEKLYRISGILVGLLFVIVTF